MTFTREEVAAVAGKLTKAQRVRLLLEGPDWRVRRPKLGQDYARLDRVDHALEDAGLFEFDLRVALHPRLTTPTFNGAEQLLTRINVDGLAVRDYLRGDRP